MFCRGRGQSRWSAGRIVRRRGCGHVTGRRGCRPSAGIHACRPVASCSGNPQVRTSLTALLFPHGLHFKAGRSSLGDQQPAEGLFAACLVALLSRPCQTRPAYKVGYSPPHLAHSHIRIKVLDSLGLYHQLMRTVLARCSLSHIALGLLLAVASLFLFRTHSAPLPSHPALDKPVAMSRSIIVAPTAKHTATIIFSHVSAPPPAAQPSPLADRRLGSQGLGDTGKGWQPFAEVCDVFGVL